MGNIIVNFNKEIYSLASIKEAIKAYKGLTVFSVATKKDYFTVTLSKIDKDVETTIKDEFCNYVLAETRS